MYVLKTIASDLASHFLQPVRKSLTDEQYRDSHERIVASLDNFRKSPEMFHVALALWQAWRELNEIRARDGVPYTHLGYQASVDENYFSCVVDDLEQAYCCVTGRKIGPWPPLPGEFTND